MAFTDFFTEGAHGGRYPDALLPRLRELQQRVLWGSDFPTLPFTYRQQLDWVADLGLGDDWLRDVCWHNAERLLGPAGSETDS
jgi:predicted TIM-barrel fold metal-dependent hydrolase